MAVHSATPFRAGWITAAYCFCLLAGGVGWQPVARAQTPASPARAVQVEIWKGNMRLRAEPPPALPSPAATEPLAAPIPTPPADVPVVPPSLPRLTITPVAGVKEVPQADNQAQLKELSQHLIRSTGQLASDCQSALDSCATSLRASGDRLVETLAVPVKAGREQTHVATTAVVTPAPAVEKSISVPDREDSLPWYKVVWLQVIVGGSALVVGPMMVAVMLGLMLRRSGLQFRVEVVHSGHPIGLGIAYGVSHLDTTRPDLPARPVGRIDPDMAAVAAMEATAPPEEQTGEQFELGPSYEEERVAKEESLLQAERAIMQEIFEENLKLHQELRTRDGADPVIEGAIACELPVVDMNDVVSEPIGYLTEDRDQAV
jgi:hypothetical protein